MIKDDHGAIMQEHDNRIAVPVGFMALFGAYRIASM